MVIPVYNGERFISEAIRSVCYQTYPPVQIIVVNDGSTDQTEKIVARFLDDKIPLQYIKQKNRGLSSARNTGIKRSSTDLIAFLDADDVWEKEKLAKQVKVFTESKFRKLGVVYCDYRNVNLLGRFLLNYPGRPLDRNIHGNIRTILFSGNKVAGSASAVLVKRECFEKAGLFDEKLLSSEDWDMWLRIARDFEFDYVPEKLVRLRRHRFSLQNDNWIMFCSDVRVVWKLKNFTIFTRCLLRWTEKMIRSRK